MHEATRNKLRLPCARHILSKGNDISEDEMTHCKNLLYAISAAIRKRQLELESLSRQDLPAASRSLHCANSSILAWIAGDR